MHGVFGLEEAVINSNSTLIKFTKCLNDLLAVHSVCAGGGENVVLLLGFGTVNGETNVM